MGCGCPEDSVRHLARCPVVRRLFSRHAGVQPPDPGFELEAFLALGDQWRLPEEVQRRALAVYALYRTYNGRRHGHLEATDFDGAFAEYLREGQRGVERLG